MKNLLLLSCTIILSHLSFGQVTVDIFPSQDNTIFSGGTSNSDGLGFLRSGQTSTASRRALLEFDIAASVPAGSIITSVTLDLNCDNVGSGAGADDYSLHLITEDWGEGTSNAGGSGSGVAATANDATWNESFFGVTSWGTAGGSFVAGASATTTLPATTGLYSWSSAGMVGDVQNWLFAPVVNFGWILIGQEGGSQNARRFGSKDMGVSPVLHVEYDCPGTVTATCQDLNVYLDIAGNATINDIDLDNGSSSTCTGTLTYSASQTSFNCGDITSAPAGTLVITGVIDGPLPGGTPKAIELYAIDNIPDLSIYGVGSANNGGGSDGEEFTFPAVALAAGTFIYVATETAEFTNWFGFAPDYVNTIAPNINGDDAIELFENSVVIDVFGDINVDGTGEPWEHLDGWAYRNIETGPDGSTFVLGNWSFSGVDALDGESANGTAATPFPTGTFSISPGFGSTPVTLTVTDEFSNTDNCVANVTVLDTLAPTVTCIGSGTFSLDGTGNLTLGVGDFDSGSSDNCAVQTSFISQTAFTCADVGAKAITLTVIDDYGNQGTCVSNIDIIEMNPVSTVVDSTTDLDCFVDSDGAAFTTSTGGNGGYTFDWDNDGLGDADDTEDLTGLTAGTYTLVVADANGCDDTVMVTITDPGNMDPTFGISNETCENANDGALDMTIPGGIAPYVIDWSNDGTGDNDDTEDIAGLSPGWYYVTIVDANGCMVSDSAEVTAGSPIDTSVVVAGAMMTSNQATGTYQWVNCPGYTVIAGATSQSYTATVDGDYAVIVTDACTDTSACITITGVGVKEDIQPTVEVYPNPTSDIVNVSLLGYSEGQVVLYDINAKVIFRKNITTDKVKFDLSNFDNGVYFVEVNTDAGTVTRKVVLQR